MQGDFPLNFSAIFKVPYYAKFTIEMLCNNKDYVYVKVCGKTVSWENMFFVMSHRL